MLLTKKLGEQAAARTPFVHSLRRGLSQALPTMDRRSFLRRSGLGVGVGLAASQLTLVKKSQAATGKVADYDIGGVVRGPSGTRLERSPSARARSKSSAPFAPTVLWVARSMRWWKTACGCAKSQSLIRPSTLAPIVPKVQHCASMAMASSACATR